MCGFAIPTIAMAALSMAQTLAQINQSNDVAAAERDAADKAAAADYEQLTLRQQQESEKTSLETVDRMRQGLRERAAMRVSAGEAGIAGITPIREQAVSMLSQAWDTGIIAENRNNQLESINAQRDEVRATQEGRYNVANAKTVNPFMAGLQIAGAGAQGAMQGYSFGKMLSDDRPTKMTPTGNYDMVYGGIGGKP